MLLNTAAHKIFSAAICLAKYTPLPTPKKVLALTGNPEAIPTKSKKPSKALGCLILLVIAGVVIVIIATATSMGSPSATFKAEIVGLTPLNASDVEVLVRVTNETSTPGKPTCAVLLSSPGGGYKGDDGFNADKSVPAHGVVVFPLKMSISKSGAQDVDIADSTVSC